METKYKKIFPTREYTPRKLEYVIEEKELIVGGKKVKFPVKVCVPQNAAPESLSRYHYPENKFDCQPSGLVRNNGKKRAGIT